MYLILFPDFRPAFIHLRRRKAEDKKLGRDAQNETEQKCRMRFNTACILTRKHVAFQHFHCTVPNLNQTTRRMHITSGNIMKMIGKSNTWSN